MRIKDYTEFLNENINTPKDIATILSLLQNASTEDILELRDNLKYLTESMNEGLNEYINNLIIKLKAKFKNTVDNRIWTYLINRKSKFYLNLADKLNMFDLESLDDIYQHYPGFKVEALYLAGGMDKAADVGAGWRLVVENEFESYPGKDTGLPPITIQGFQENITPKRIVNDIYLDMLIENPKKTKKLYNYPLVLNPVRKEVDRTKDQDFFKAATTYKTFTHETPPEEFEPTMTSLRRTLSRSIEPGDEHLVKIADFVFLGLNQAAAAGTFGELQMLSLLNKPMFVWMTSPKWGLGQTTEDPNAGFSPWTFPHISKIARNEKEMKILVSTIMDNV